MPGILSISRRNFARMIGVGELLRWPAAHSLAASPASSAIRDANVVRLIRTRIVRPIALASGDVRCFQSRLALSDEHADTLIDTLAKMNALSATDSVG